MKIDLIAQLKNKDGFFTAYVNGDEKKLYVNKSLIFYSLSNGKKKDRYEISSFLLDKGVDVLGENLEKETPLHVLLGQVDHNIKDTEELCRRLLDCGVNINALDSKKRTAFQYIVNMNKTDNELIPLYDLWFSQKNLDFTTPNKQGYAVLDLIKKLPYRSDLLERVKSYEYG